MNDKGLFDKVKGSAKEVAGKATGNVKLEVEGKLDKAAGKAKEVVSDVKEAAEDAINKIKK